MNSGETTLKNTLLRSVVRNRTRKYKPTIMGAGVSSDHGFTLEEIVKHVNTQYNLTDNRYFNGDPRSDDWPFMKGPESVIVATFIYLLVVKYGPQVMADREPIKATWLMVIYNFFMVALSVWMTLEAVIVIWSKEGGVLCQPVDYSSARELTAGWWYFFSKIIEFLDTVFFILRKKNNQITFLHVYHHSTMAVMSWYCARYLPGGEKLYVGGLNTLVHVFMYTYYGLAAIGPHMQKYLWWKKYLTTFQIVQFVCVIVRSVLSILVYPECEYPRWTNVWTVGYAVTLLFLFGNFYRQSYVTKKTSSHHSNSNQSNGKREHAE